MDEEQPVRIVFLFYLGKTRIVAAPVRLLEIPLEVVAFTDVSTAWPGDLAELIHTSIDALGESSAFLKRRLVPSNSGVGGFLAIAHDR